MDFVCLSFQSAISKCYRVFIEYYF